jgi:hypothetical protein
MFREFCGSVLGTPVGRCHRLLPEINDSTRAKRIDMGARDMGGGLRRRAVIRITVMRDCSLKEHVCRL